MPSKGINHLAVWVSAIVFFIWGYVWFSVLFKNKATELMAAAGMPASGAPSPASLVIAFLMALVLGYGTAVALKDSDNRTAGHGISFGIFMGIVFYAAITLIQAVFTGHLALWLLDIGWALIGFALVGAIVGGWQSKERAAAAAR